MNTYELSVNSRFPKSLMKNTFSNKCRERKIDFLYMCLSFSLRTSLDSESKIEESPVRS